MLAETDAARAMQTVKGMPPFYGITDITGTVDRADKGAVLTIKEILAVSRTLAAARAVRDYRNSDHTEASALDEYFERLSPNKFLEEKDSCALCERGHGGRYRERQAL